MPSTYAHRLFGSEMLKLYPKDIKTVCEENLPLYSLGLHGPDILFYYKPLKDNPVQRIGYYMHGQSGKLFFSRAALCSATGEASFAYAIGAVCHYALDGACHSYIENKIAVSGVKHTEIESEFDKYLLKKEGEDPFKKDLVSHIVVSKAFSEVIARFYDGLGETLTAVGGKDIYRALKSMLFYNRLMQGKNPLKRGIVNASLKLSGNYPEMHGMMFSLKDIEKCADSNMRLEKLFKKAEENCLLLTDEFISFVNSGKPLSDRFNPTFGPAEGWQNIPVLSSEEEKNYEV